MRQRSIPCSDRQSGPPPGGCAVQGSSGSRSGGRAGDVRRCDLATSTPTKTNDTGSGFIAEHQSACGPNRSLSHCVSRASPEFQQRTERIVRAESGYCIIVVISRATSPQLQCNDPQFGQDTAAWHRKSLTATSASRKLAASIDKGKSVARRRRKAMGPTGFARLPNREYGIVLGTATAAPWPRSTSCLQRQARFFRTRVGRSLCSECGFRVLHAAGGRDSLPQADDEA